LAPVSIAVPLGKHQHQRIQRVVGVRGRAAGPSPLELLATTTRRGCRPISLAGSGAELATELGRAGRLNLTHRRARGPIRTRAPAVEDLDVPEMPAGCPPGSRRSPPCPLRLVPPDRNVNGTPWAAENGRTAGPDLRRVHRGDYHARGESEVRGVMAQPQPVRRPASDLPRTTPRARTQTRLAKPAEDSGSVRVDLRCSFSQHSCAFEVGLLRTTACLRIGTEFIRRRPSIPGPGWTAGRPTRTCLAAGPKLHPNHLAEQFTLPAFDADHGGGDRQVLRRDHLAQHPTGGVGGGQPGRG